MASFTEIPPLSTDIPRHVKQMSTDERTDGRNIRKHNASAAYCRWRHKTNTTANVLAEVKKSAILKLSYTYSSLITTNHTNADDCAQMW